jgi:hypothetical protein
MSIVVRLLASGVLLLGAAAPSAGVATIARTAGTAGYCPSGTGVTVVVDFTDLGGNVVVRCAPGEPGTGLDALAATGFTFEGTQRWGTAFVCRLQGRPTAQEKLPVKGDPDYQEQCVDTPPTAASWSYSHAENGGEWEYSTSSAKTHRAIEGGFEGWRFTLNGSGTEPSVAPLRPGSDTSEPQEPKEPDEPIPPRRRRERPSEPPPPEPTDQPTHQPTPQPTDQPSVEPTDEASRQPSASGRPSRPDKPGEKKVRRDRTKEKGRDKAGANGNGSGRADETGLGTTTEGATVTGELPAESAADAEEDATSGTTTLLGVGLLTLLGAGAAVTAYRRRSQQP